MVRIRDGLLLICGKKREKLMIVAEFDDDDCGIGPNL
jgi:hypothetical protein